MKTLTTLLLFASFAVATRAASDIFFLPAEVGASISFEGTTQAGRDTHRFEVRRLAYVHPGRKEEWPTTHLCVIYYAGAEYGPHILKEMQAIDSLVRKTGNDIVEVFFTAGARTNIRQRWKLLGYDAKLEQEEAIRWEDDPRSKKKPN